MSLLPLPEAVYPNPTTAFNTIQLHAKAHRYAFIELNKKPSDYYLPAIALVTTTIKGIFDCG
jgi:hypothetical protein